MASTYLTRTFSASPTSDKIITFSVWFKRSGLGEQHIFGNRATDNYRSHLYFDSSDRFNILGKKTDGTGNDSIDITTNRRFKDTNGWYHLVVAIDTTQATTANRVKLYVNGVLETSFAQEVNPSQNDVLQLNKDLAHEIGSYDGSNYYFNGLMSHIHFIDGTQYAASDFGETDATTGEWKIKTSPSVTYGDNGFFILKDGNSVTDQSGNSNNFTVGGGTLTKTEDCPSNVFATLNPLQINAGNFTIANGNTKITRSGSWRGMMSTIGVNKGKYYWECKQTGNMALGIGKFGGDVDSYTYLSDSTAWLGDKATAWIYYNNGSSIVKYNNNTSGTYGSVPTDNDIISVAFDADNGTIWIGKNGTWENSATEAEIEAGTTTNAMYSGITIGTDLFGAIGAVENGTLEYNFGNGYFGTSAISSAGTNASGIGIFEYNVPDGFTALSTKGLNE